MVYRIVDDQARLSISQQPEHSKPPVVGAGPKVPWDGTKQCRASTKWSILKDSENPASWSSSMTAYGNVLY